MTKKVNKFDVKALREKVMTHDDIKHDEVYVEEWDVTLPVRTIATSDLKKVMKYKDDPIRMSALAVIYGCKTKEGEAVFTETDLAKMEAEKSFGAIQEIAEKVLELSGFGDKAVDEAAKN
jgi:hypothetical protein